MGISGRTPVDLSTCGGISLPKKTLMIEKWDVALNTSVYSVSLLPHGHGFHYFKFTYTMSSLSCFSGYFFVYLNLVSRFLTYSNIPFCLPPL